MCRFKGISCIVNIYTLQILIIFLRARFEMGWWWGRLGGASGWRRLGGASGWRSNTTEEGGDENDKTGRGRIKNGNKVIMHK